MDRMTQYLLAGIAALMLLFSSVYVVREGQTAIVLNLGKVVRTGIGPGLHFKVPLMETVRRFDKRILTLTATDERYLTSEQKDVQVDFFVNWRIKDEVAFYRAINGDNAAAEERFSPIVVNGLRNVVNSSTLRELADGNREEITVDLLKTINGSTSTLGIEVLAVRIKAIDYPKDPTPGSSSVLDSVYERMRKDRNEVAKRTRAEGDEAAQKIRSEAERDRQVLLAEAEREAQTLRGEGDARAAEVSAAAFGQDAEFYAFYRSLEAYRASLADGNTVMLLDPDSEFLRYFEKGSR